MRIAFAPTAHALYHVTCHRLTAGLRETLYRLGILHTTRVHLGPCSRAVDTASAYTELYHACDYRHQP